MNIAEHVTFDQLTTQAKCLLTIATMSASLRTGNSRRQSGEALASVARGFWNESALAPAACGDLSAITDQLCTWIRSTRTTQN